MAGSASDEHGPAPLNLWSPLPSGIDANRVDAADKILKIGNVAVCKPTRAGFTTSAVIAAERKGLKTLVAAPTRKILNDTVRDTVKRMGGVPCDIPGNHACKYVQELIQKDPLLGELPIMMKDRCDNCEDFDTCPVTEIERIDNFTTATITYAKLEAVMLSSSDSAESIREKLADVDLIILDEAHLLSFPSLPQVDFGRIVMTPDRYGSLLKVLDKWFDINGGENRDIAHQIEIYTEQDPRHYSGFSVTTHCFFTWQEKSKMWGELVDLAENREVCFPMVNDEDILAFRDIITIMSSSTATISYLKSKDIGRMVVTGSQGTNQMALRQFLTEVAPNAQVIFVSGTLVERRVGFFSELSGRDIKSVIFPDLNNTNSKMFIHPSTWKFSSRSGGDGIDHAINEIRVISESVEHQSIYLLAMNTIFATQLKKALADLPNIKVDYYKSKDSIGVAQDARICIAVGAAEIPRHACDPLAQGNDDDARFFDSQQPRINAVHTATWQAISRVKDPDGAVESHVFCVGIRAEEVSKIATWGTKREVKVELNGNGGIDSSVKCKEYLGRPNTIMEERSDLRPSRRTIADYVDAIVPISDVIKARQKSDTFPYNNIVGDTVRFLDEPLRLYNAITSYEEYERSYFSLTTLFVTRLDKCGLQNKQANPKGKFGYYAGKPPMPFQDLLEEHLLSIETIALPPFDLDDNCYFCAIDFDDHDGNTPQSENVKNLTGFLKERDLPSIVVKSGSNDGYHAFIPIVPTKTLVAHKFIKQLVKDVGLEGHKEIERFPKQKSSNSTKNGYGNQIKLPLAQNWKAGKKSEVVDPYTLESVKFIEVTRAVKLRDLPELVEKKSQIAAEAKTTKKTEKIKKATGSYAQTIYPSGEMRTCIRGIIDSGVQLEGGEGHQMRVAIVAESLHCGLSEEETARLFANQNDFDEQVTLKNIRYIWGRNYRKYGCEKMQDQCGSFVKGYCDKCPLSRGEF